MLDEPVPWSPMETWSQVERHPCCLQSRMKKSQANHSSKPWAGGQAQMTSLACDAQDWHLRSLVFIGFWEIPHKTIPGVCDTATGQAQIRSFHLQLRTRAKGCPQREGAWHMVSRREGVDTQQHTARAPTVPGFLKSSPWLRILTGISVPGWNYSLSLQGSFLEPICFIRDEMKQPSGKSPHVFRESIFHLGAYYHVFEECFGISPTFFLESMWELCIYP